MNNKILVIGGSNIDVCCKSDKKIINKDSNIGKVEFALGGVGRNIAEDLSLFGADTSLITAIGNDSFGHVVRDNAEEQNIALLIKPFKNEKTGVYAYVSDSDGSFVLGVNDMDITSKLTPEIIEENGNFLLFSDYVVLEANLPQETIEKVCSYDVKLIADCVSGVKCRRLANVLDKLFLLKANLLELKVLTGKQNLEDGVRDLVSRGLKQGIVTLGENGAMCFETTSEGIVCYKIPNMPDFEVVDTGGCGDAFLSGYIIGIMRGHNAKECLIMGQSAATLNAQGLSSVNREMTYAALKKTVGEYNEKTTVERSVLK